MNSIIERQNSKELLKLLRASSTAYTKAKRGENRITYFLIFLAFAYPITYLIIKDENVKLTLFGCSFLLTVLIQIFTDTFKGNTSMGAIFKEEFDTILFKLPWKSTLKKPDYSDVSNYSLQYKGDEINNWYSPNISEAIPSNVSVAILQHFNSSWDIELRVSYLKYLTLFLITYSIALWIFLITKNSDGQTIFSIYFSILSFYTHFFSLFRGHLSAINKRKVISRHLDDIIRSRKDIRMEELRDIQDEIYLIRLEPVKVPNFFSKWYKKRMYAVAEDYIESINKIYD